MQPDVRDFQVGVMFWADRDRLAEIKSLGVSCGQLGISGGIDLTPAVVEDWQAAIRKEQFSIVTVVAAYNGESYVDIPTVQKTVGFVPAATRAEREARTVAISDFAAALGVNSIACHIGFVPENRGDEDYLAVREMVRRICEHAGRHGQTFALETGQEPAPVLLRFIEDVGRDNLRINFDPANMVLYGTGDPVEALEVLGKYVVSVHCKDGNWPPTDQPGALGTEVPLGRGAVGIGRFLAKLREIGYRGTLNIEREAQNQEERIADIRAAVPYLRSLGGV